MSFVSFSFAALITVVLLGRFTIGRTKRGAPYQGLLVARERGLLPPHPQT